MKSIDTYRKKKRKTKMKRKKYEAPIQFRADRRITREILQKEADKHNMSLSTYLKRVIEIGRHQVKLVGLLLVALMVLNACGHSQSVPQVVVTTTAPDAPIVATAPVTTMPTLVTLTFVTGSKDHGPLQFCDAMETFDASKEVIILDNVVFGTNVTLNGVVESYLDLSTGNCLVEVRKGVVSKVERE